MRKLRVSLIGIALAAFCVIAPSKDVKAVDNGYILTQQAKDLLCQAESERDDAKHDVKKYKKKVEELRDQGIGGDELNEAYEKLDHYRRKLDRKEDKVSKARYVLDFVNSRSDSEIFLAQMQEKNNNLATLAPMQDKINGAKAILSAQQTQLQNIQQGIDSQTTLAKTNPAIMAQVQQLQAVYQVELAQYQAEQQAVAQLEQQYAAYVATLPTPTAADNMRLSEIRSDFLYACQQFDAACNE